MSDAQFINLICRETDAGLLLDIENLYLNAINHGFGARWRRFGWRRMLRQVLAEIEKQGRETAPH